MRPSFVEQLGSRVLEGAAPACVGIDPRPEQLPNQLLPSASVPERLTAFCAEILPVLAETVPAVKPNIAFFEAHGPAGFGAYAEVCRQARDLGLLVVGDIKRGDIGSTAEAYASYHGEIADAVTLHPYLGRDALEPFLQRAGVQGLGLFILVRTSNPGADLFQSLILQDGARVVDEVARAVDHWGEDTVDIHGFSSVGAVVGATRPEEIGELRARMPRAWFLLPGVGAQGGSVEPLKAAVDGRGLGALATSSRGVTACFDPDASDWLDQVRTAAGSFAEQARALVPKD